MKSQPYVRTSPRVLYGKIHNHSAHSHALLKLQWLRRGIFPEHKGGTEPRAYVHYMSHV